MSVSLHPKNEFYTYTNFDRVISSPGQAKFGFAKARRFTYSKPVTEVVGYTLPSTISSKAAGFGFGKQTPFPLKKGNCIFI
jgi:hypothetical protein